MKKTIFISSILAACVACAAEVKVQETTIDDNKYQYLYVRGDNGFFDELTINHIKLESRYKSTITVDGKTTINSNIPSGNFYGCVFGNDTTFISDSIEFNCLTTYYPSSISIQGTVQTDSFTVKATEDYPVKITITDSGKLEARGKREADTFTIGANVSVKVGNATEGSKGSIGLKTVVDGGSLHVYHYAFMNGLSLKKGDVLINLDNFVSDNSAGVPLESSIKLGDITVEGGTMTLDGTSIESKIEMISGEGGTSGTLNILGDVKTGALTLNSGTINVGSESVKSTLTTNSVLLVDGATLNLINGDLKAVSMNSGSIVVSTGSTIEALTLSGGTLSGDLSGCTVTTAGDDEESVKVSVNVTNGDVTAVEGTELSGTISEGALTTKAGSKVSADITDTEITATGGEISGTISGTSSVEVKDGGSTTLSGDNSYTGGTTVSNGALTAGSNKALGTGTVKLGADGELNLNSKEVSNDIEAAGGVLSGAEQYLGNLVVKEDLVIVGDVTANSITLLDNGGITMQAATTTFSLRATAGGAVARTDAMVVRTKGDGAFTGNLTLNEDGLIELNNGNSLAVTGALTLGNGTKIGRSVITFAKKSP